MEGTRGEERLKVLKRLVLLALRRDEGMTPMNHPLRFPLRESPYELPHSLPIAASCSKWGGLVDARQRETDRVAPNKWLFESTYKRWLDDLGGSTPAMCAIFHRRPFGGSVFVLLGFFGCFSRAGLVKWLVGWMAGWVVGWLDGWMVGWLDGWLDGCMVVWLDGWMVGWLDGWMVGWLDGRMVGWLDGWMVGWLDGWMVGWLVGWLVGCRIPGITSLTWPGLPISSQASLYPQANPSKAQLPKMMLGDIASPAESQQFEVKWANSFWRQPSSTPGAAYGGAGAAEVRVSGADLQKGAMGRRGVRKPSHMFQSPGRQSASMG